MAGRINEIERMQFVVEENIDLKSIQKIVERAVDLHGCTGCGLTGLDLKFRVRENPLFEKFKDIKGLHDVNFERF